MSLVPNQCHNGARHHAKHPPWPWGHSHGVGTSYVQVE